MSNKLSNAIKKSVSVASVAALLAVVSACGGEGSSSDKGTTDESAAEAAQERVDAALEPVTDLGITTPLDAPPEEGKLAYFIRYNNEGAATYDKWPEVAAKAGWEGRVLAIDGADPQAGSNAIKQAVSAGADYITVNSNSLDALQAGMDVAKAEGVPVFFLAGVGEPEGEKNGLYGNVANVDGIVDFSTVILDWTIADSEGGADIIYVNYPDAQILGESEPEIKARFEENCPECSYQLLDVSTDQLVNGDIVDSVVAELRKNPDIKYVTTTLAPSALGLREALDAAGLTDVQIGVASPSVDQFDSVRDGDIAVISAFGEEDSMYATLDQMLRLDQGMDVEQDTHASRPFQLFDEETIGDATDWEGPEGYEEQYLELWNLN